MFVWFYEKLSYTSHGPRCLVCTWGPHEYSEPAPHFFPSFVSLSDLLEWKMKRVFSTKAVEVFHTNYFMKQPNTRKLFSKPKIISGSVLPGNKHPLNHIMI